MLRISSKHLIQRKWRGFSLSSQRYLSSESNNEPILKKFPSPFPWRSSPFIIEFPWSISMKHSIMKFFYFRFVSDISEEEFLQGAIAAYSGSTSNLLQYIESRTNDSDADESILKTTFTPILATFYQKWLNDFFQQYPRGSIKIHHKVFDDKDAPAIALIKAVTASTRTSITEDTFQSIAPLKFEEYKRNKLEDIASIEQEDGRKEVAINTVYIRYDVNIQCKELFYIEDTRTGELIQGSKEPTTRTHHVALGFAALRHPSVIFDSDWRIVDIDQWLLSGVDRDLGWRQEIESSVKTIF